MSEFGFLERIDRKQSDRLRIEDLHREGFKLKLKHIANDTERAVDYCNDLIRSGADVSDELKELETTANGLLLTAGLLRLRIQRERNNG